MSRLKSAMAEQKSGKRDSQRQPPQASRQQFPSLGRRLRSPKEKKAADVCGFVLNVGSKRDDLLLGVFVLIDLLAGAVLLAIELFLLRFGQVTVVRGHVSFFLILNVLFAIFHARSLARCHGAVLDAIGDAVLLILLASVDFVDARMAGIDLTRPAPEVFWV